MTNEIKNVPELRFPEFKEEWVEKKLGEITSKISDGIHSTPTYDSNGDIYFINGNNLVNGRIDFKTSKKISVQEFNKYKNYLEAKNTLLLSINGTIGNIAKYEGENILLGKSAAYINVVSKFISRCYIFYYLQTSKIYESFLRELTGTTIKNLSLKSIKNIIVYISELDEQQKIGEFFSKLDRQIELEEQKLEKLEEQKKGYMQQIFSQKLRFKNENRDDYLQWNITTIEKIAKVSKGFTPSTKDINLWQNDNKNWLSIAGMSDKYIYEGNKGISIAGEGKHKKVNEDTLIMSFKLTLGKVAIVKTPIYTNEAICHFEWKTNQIKTDYMYYYLSFTNIKSFGAQAVKGITLNNDSINSIVIKLPEFLEQNKIGNFFNKCDELIEKQNQKIDGLKKRKQGFLQKMFV